MIRWVTILAVIIAGLGLFGCGSDSTEPNEDTCSTPTFSLDSGLYYEEQMVTISCSTLGAVIRFTVDGSTPEKTSQIYEHPLHVSSDLTIKARAFKRNYNNRNVSMRTYSFELNRVAPVICSPYAGSYQYPQTVSLSCPTTGATIYYTMDNVDIVSQGQIYTEPLFITTTTLLYVVAKKNGMEDSHIQQFSYYISQQQVPTPAIYPASGTYTGPIIINMTCSLYGANIRYTKDGSEPTSESSLYSGPFEVDDSATIKSKAYNNYYTDSQTTTANYSMIPAVNAMVYVQGGAIMMGGTINADEKPIHAVTLSPFYISKYEITNGEWSEVVGNRKNNPAKTMNTPKTNVSIYDVMIYCNKRSIREGLTPVYSVYGQTNPDYWNSTFPSNPGSIWENISCNNAANGYRLPTEAEWEYAARGATDNPNFTYSGSMDLYATGWWIQNSDNTTHYVGRKQVNALSLYDLSGNVWEWVWDWYDSAYYSASPVNNPLGPAEGTNKVIRGGCFNSYAVDCRVAARMSKPVDYRNNDLGFRILRNAQ